MSKYRREHDCKCADCRSRAVDAQKRYLATKNGRATLRKRVISSKYKRIQRDYRNSALGKKMRRKSLAKHVAKYPEKISARKAVHYAVKVGNLVKPKVCEHCGKHTLTEASHTDYSKKLDVEWLCRSCHMKKDGLAYVKPTDEDELMGVEGIGKKKAEAMYGVLEELSEG